MRELATIIDSRCSSDRERDREREGEREKKKGREREGEREEKKGRGEEGSFFSRGDSREEKCRTHGVGSARVRVCPLREVASGGSSSGWVGRCRRRLG